MASTPTPAELEQQLRDLDAAIALAESQPALIEQHRGAHNRLELAKEQHARHAMNAEIARSVAASDRKTRTIAPAHHRKIFVSLDRLQAAQIGNWHGVVAFHQALGAIEFFEASQRHKEVHREAHVRTCEKLHGEAVAEVQTAQESMGKIEQQIKAAKAAVQSKETSA